MNEIIIELDRMSLDELIALRVEIDALEIVEDEGQAEFELEMMILEDAEHPRYSEVMAKYS